MKPKLEWLRASLKNDNSVRLTKGRRWLYWDQGQWVVRESPGRRGAVSVTIVATDNEARAVKALLGLDP